MPDPMAQPEAVEAKDQPPANLSEYEQQREENIKRNQDFMKTLNMGGTKDQMQAMGMNHAVPEDRKRKKGDEKFHHMCEHTRLFHHMYAHTCTHRRLICTYVRTEGRYTCTHRRPIYMYTQKADAHTCTHRRPICYALLEDIFTVSYPLLHYALLEDIFTVSYPLL